MKSRIAAAIAAIALTACLLPEEFQATIQVAPTGEYTFSFDGTVAHVLAALEIKETGKLTLNDEAAFRSETASMLKDPIMKKARYIGNGRYDISIVERKSRTEPLHVLDYFRVEQDKEGNTVIRSVKLDEGMMADLRRLAIRPAGKLSVNLPRNAKVIESNEDSVSRLPDSDGGTYTWFVTVNDKAPTIKYKLR